MKKLLTTLATLAAMLCSCSKWPGTVPDEECASPYEVGHEMIELGDQLNDPYSLANVEAAVKSLYPTKAMSLSATDIYVRFLPKNEDEYDHLTDMGVNLIDHPLDFQIIRDGDYYHDPTVADDAITWQYSVVSPKFKFPKDIEYEILDECYIPDTSSETKGPVSEIDWTEVEKEAFRISGNSELLNVGTKSDNAPEPAAPCGKIQIVDQAFNGGKPIGVKGVTVSVNSFVKFASAYTDDEGNYRIDKVFTSNIRYRLVFKNVKGFGIGFNLLLVPASISSLGKGDPKGVDLLMDSDSDRKQFARSVVNNAVYDYYSMTEETGSSVRTPPANLRLWLFQKLNLSCSPMFQQGSIIDSGVVAGALGEYRSLIKMFLPDVLLGLKDCPDYASIYSEALHQLAHTSHYMQVGNDFWDALVTFNLKSFVTSGFITYGVGTEENAGYCEVGEMWAYFMQNSLYRERYGKDCQAIGGSFWFHPQVFLYLDERGVTRGKIFKALQPDVIDREVLEKKLIALYPENRSIISQAFERYCN